MYTNRLYRIKTKTHIHHKYHSFVKIFYTNIEHLNYVFMCLDKIIHFLAGPFKV